MFYMGNNRSVKKTLLGGVPHCQTHSQTSYVVGMMWPMNIIIILPYTYYISNSPIHNTHQPISNIYGQGGGTW